MYIQNSFHDRTYTKTDKRNKRFKPQKSTRQSTSHRMAYFSI